MCAAHGSSEWGFNSSLDSVKVDMIFVDWGRYSNGMQFHVNLAATGKGVDRR